MQSICATQSKQAENSLFNADILLFFLCNLVFLCLIPLLLTVLNTGLIFKSLVYRGLLLNFIMHFL